MCLTILDIYPSHCVEAMAMAPVPSVKTRYFGLPICKQATVTKFTYPSTSSSFCVRVSGGLAEQCSGVRALSKDSAAPVYGQQAFRMRLRTLMAAPGPGGGVLDRPVVLPGYDNK